MKEKEEKKTKKQKMKPSTIEARTRSQNYVYNNFNNLSHNLQTNDQRHYRTHITLHQFGKTCERTSITSKFL